MTGVFSIANKLFGLKFEEVYDIDTYHQDVKTYVVKDNDGNLVAIFMPIFPRPGKGMARG